MEKNSKIKLVSGNEMPLMGLGTWHLSHDTADVIVQAFKLGYRLIDTSNDYGTQRSVGVAVQRTTVKREDIFIATKVEENDDAYERVMANLKELGLDWVDLTLIHRPPILGAGKKLWDGLIRAKNEGLTKDIGVSNYSIELIDELIEVTGEVPVVNQIEWSPFGRSDEVQEYCNKKGIIIMAYSPLTRGEKLDDGILNQIARKYQKTPAQILIRWNLQTGTVPIPKANRIAHLEENFDVFDFEISDFDMNTLNGLNDYYSSLGSLPYI